ncbi:MAG: hypothetical protein OSA11_02180 [Candidatus Nanopelagicales bacterium]|nr:hypothetical protein [Candidatus Nanopelagicales bacterium]
MSEHDQKRRVLILGASSDIGLALTQTYLNAGFRVTGHFPTVIRKRFDPFHFHTPSGGSACCLPGQVADRSTQRRPKGRSLAESSRTGQVFRIY